MLGAVQSSQKSEQDMQQLLLPRCDLHHPESTFPLKLGIACDSQQMLCGYIPRLPCPIMFHVVTLVPKMA